MSATQVAPTILIVPGLRDHVPDHWQTHSRAASRPRRVTVPRMEHDKLSCAAWVALARPVAARDRGDRSSSSPTAQES